MASSVTPQGGRLRTHQIESEDPEIRVMPWETPATRGTRGGRFRVNPVYLRALDFDRDRSPVLSAAGARRPTAKLLGRLR